MTICLICGYPMTQVFNGRGSYICMNCDYETTPFLIQSSVTGHRVSDENSPGSLCASTGGSQVPPQKVERA